MLAALGSAGVLAVLGGCLNDEPVCEEDAARCVGRTAMTCVGALSSDFSPDNETEWDTEVCASAELCHVVGDVAFCSIETEPNPICAPVLGFGFVCDGSTHITCERGFVGSRARCGACAPTAGVEGCSQRLGGPCDDTSPCLEGLTCVGATDGSDGVCAAECDCEPGASCALCESFWSSSGAANQCIDGRCQRVLYGPIE